METSPLNVRTKEGNTHTHTHLVLVTEIWNTDSLYSFDYNTWKI